jgi:hypothetical protein
VDHEDKLSRVVSLLNNISRRLDRAEAADAANRADAIADAQARRRRSERDQLAQVALEGVEMQARADSVLQPYNVRAPSPVAGEDLGAYHRRILDVVRARLPSTHALYRLDLGRVRDDALEVFASQIFDAATALAYDPSSVPPGRIVERDRSSNGVKITGFVSPIVEVVD